jgi:hypothetical protein
MPEPNETRHGTPSSLDVSSVAVSQLAINETYQEDRTMSTIPLVQDTTSAPVSIPFGEVAPRALHIAVGACKLTIRPGEGTEWVTGTYSGHTDALPLEIRQDGGTVRIDQRYEWSEIVRLFDGVPTLELALGKAMPYDLIIDTGASESYLDLGGLPLTHLALNMGAGKITIDFSAPNPMEMSTLSVASGASSIEIRNLANANAGEVKAEGGAVAYKVDFGGTLRRAMNMRATAAMSSVDLIIPSSTPARITSQAIMGGVNAGDGYTRSDGAFWTQAAVASLQPTIAIQVSLTMGGLTLRNG